MNSRQRRGIILLILSVLCAVGAFVGVLTVIRDVNSKVGPEVTAYRLKSDVAPYKALSTAQFDRVSMPKRWLSENAVTDISEIRGKIAVTQLKKGSLLQTDMLVKRPELQPGEQEIAIMIDAETGVAGKITPGSKVNVYATFESDKKLDPKHKQEESWVIVSGARVIDVGKITPLEPDAKDRNRKMKDAVPITFALSTRDAQRIAYAESFAVHVRLARIPDGSDPNITPRDRIFDLPGDRT
ncbi:Flp pilus assembly protein CpaB [Streptomyces spiroverticillatus]|uniref:Flp pilus assembly protein CpaB n=1 Tax=Streptomyces finlayi TaxID=67296 RepID=A0A919C7F0_9ACTN|nr:Flp pilus assembly protein CpaB [Streptomyces finlayi]GGZ86727.1 Flp pilus assembly protein CpaB [Streptomyces spiroverticillatus]GHC78209.1 Flp pilus assembly protein CpaB [Streptomyces finlayi]